MVYSFCEFDWKPPLIEIQHIMAEKSVLDQVIRFEACYLQNDSFTSLQASVVSNFLFGCVCCKVWFIGVLVCDLLHTV